MSVLTSHDFQQAARFLALVLLGVSAGALTKFFTTVNKGAIKHMPWWAGLAIMCWVVALTSMTLENLHENWNWFQSPMIILGCVFCLIGVGPYLKIKHPYKQ